MFKGLMCTTTRVLSIALSFTPTARVIQRQPHIKKEESVNDFLVNLDDYDTVDVKVECAIDRSRVVVHIRPFKLSKTLYVSCFMLARKPGPINFERRKQQYQCGGCLLSSSSRLLLLLLAIYVPYHPTIYCGNYRSIVVC